MRDESSGAGEASKKPNLLCPVFAVPFAALPQRDKRMEAAKRGPIQIEPFGSIRQNLRKHAATTRGGRAEYVRPMS